MNQLLLRAALGVLLSFGALSVAHAQWSTQVSHPDAFGNRRAVAAVSGGKEGHRLVVQCNQKNVLALAYIFPVTPKKRDQMKSDGPMPVTLLLTADNGKAMNLDALMRVWNQNYGGYVAYGRTSSLMKAIKAIGAADTDISVSVQATGVKASDDFTAKGSTLAMNTVTKACDLSNIPASEGSGTDQGAPSGTVAHPDVSGSLTHPD